MNQMIRILLADDHAVVREGLRGLLEQQSDMRVIAEAGDGAAALELLMSERPDVIVLDMKMPGPTAVETIARGQAPAP